MFMISYQDVYRRLGRTAVAPENGPASTRMFDELRAFYSTPGPHRGHGPAALRPVRRAAK
jgi:hypothetical protein